MKKWSMTEMPVACRSFARFWVDFVSGEAESTHLSFSIYLRPSLLGWSSVNPNIFAWLEERHAVEQSAVCETNEQLVNE